MLILCNILMPQLLWFESVRQNVQIMWVIAIIVNIGMWLERFVIVITSLHRDFLPSVLGHVLPDDLGHCDLCRHDRIFPAVHSAVHPRSAGDLDLRDAELVHDESGGHEGHAIAQVSDVESPH